MHYERLAGPVYDSDALADRLDRLPFPLATHLAPQHIEMALELAPDRVRSHFSLSDDMQRGLLAGMLGATWTYDEAVLQALAGSPQRPFVRPSSRVIANWAGVNVIGGSNAIESAWLVAFIATRLRVRKGMRVLVLGAGAGFGLALLANIVGSGGGVLGVELDGQIRDRAAHVLGDVLGISNVRLVTGDALAWSGPAPFDAIWSTLSVDEIPGAWTDLLAPHGHLIGFVPAHGPIGRDACAAVELVCIERTSAGFTSERILQGLVNAAFSSDGPVPNNPFGRFSDQEDAIATRVAALMGR